MKKLMIATIPFLLLVSALVFTVSASTMLNSPRTAEPGSGQTLVTPAASEQATFTQDNRHHQTAVINGEDANLASPPGPEREVTINPAGKESELPTKAQAPEKNPVWNGGAFGHASKSAASKGK